MDEQTRGGEAAAPGPGPDETAGLVAGESAPNPGLGDLVPGEAESAYDLLQRGQALLARRHHAQAAIVLARAARLEPGRGSILEPLGRACFMAGQLERAAEAFEALLAVDPSSAYGHYALGRTLFRAGRPAEGTTHLRLAAALAPDSRLYRGGLRRLAGE